jgi:hypothetical protein
VAERAHSTSICNLKSVMNATTNMQNTSKTQDSCCHSGITTVLAVPACQDALQTSSQSTATVTAAGTEHPKRLLRDLSDCCC